jgi:hypothetical protein
MDDTQEQNAPAMETLLADVIAEQSEAEKAEAKPAKAEAETETAETETEDLPEGEEAGEKAPAETPEDDDGEKPDEDKPKKRISGSERWKRRAMAAEQALAERGRDSDGGASQAAIESVIGKPPKEEDFKGDFLAFERAQTAYEVRKAIQEDRQRDQAQARSAAEQAVLQDMIDDHADRVAEFKTKVPDFDDVIKGVAGKHPLNESLFRLLIESDKSAHLAYHLAKNPDRIDRLNAMSPVAAAREIGRIESRLSLPQPKKQTQASKPVTPPKGGAAPSSQDSELEGWLKKTYRS